MSLWGTLKLFTCTDHDCHWPVGVASIVVARDEAEARVLLERELAVASLDPKEPFTLKEIDATIPGAYILCDGNY